MAERIAFPPSVPRAFVLLCALVTVASAQATPSPAAPSDQPASSRRRIEPDWGRMSFQTATVKLNTSGSQRTESNFPIGIYDWYLPVNGVFSTKNFPLIAYIAFAYKVSSNDAISLMPQLPAWVRTTRYDIQAQAPDHMATKDQMRVMVQSLLAKQFNLKIHAETKTVSVYALVLSTPGKTGPHLQPHPPGDKACSTKASNKMDGVFPATCSGITPIKPTIAGDYRFGARNLDFTRIVDFVPSGGLDRQILDKTGLSGQYDFNLEWPPARAAPLPAATTHADPNQPDPLANFARALDQQLGLKLVPQEAPTRILVLDSISRPTEN